MKGKKLIACMLSAAMAISLSACGGDSGKDDKTDDTAAVENDGSGTDEDSASEADAAEDVTSEADAGVDDTAGADGETNGYFKKYDEEISLTTHMVYPTTWKWLEGDDANNNGQTRWLKSHMGINMSCIWDAPDSETDSQKLELAFAGDNLPDVIQATPAQITKYAAAGKLVDIKALIEEYGSPLLKYMVEDAEDITQGTLFQPYTYEGTAYALPITSDTTANWNMNFIRSDILDELNMEVPGSIDEMEAVFEAYKAKYPEGVALGLDNALQSGKMQFVMSAYQAYPTSWVEKDGGLVYGSIQPEVKEGLAKMAEWYQKGYIDPEFVTKDSDRMNQDIAAGNVLSFWFPWWFVLATGQDLWTGVEGSEVLAIPFLTDANGNSGIMNQVGFNPGRAITTKCEHPEAFIYMLNEYLDSFYRNEGALREKMKKEYQYEFKYPVTEQQEPLNKEAVNENGEEPRYDYPEELTGPNFWNDHSGHFNWWYGLTGLIPSVANGHFGEMTRAAKEGGPFEGMSAGALLDYTNWSNTAAGEQALETFCGIYDYFEPLQTNEAVYHVNGFNGAPTAAMVEKQTYLDKLELETFTRIIMGTEPLDAFDAFVEEWNANGGETITAEVNEWYQSMQ